MSSFDPYDRPDDAFNPYESPRAAPGRPEWAYETGAASSLPFGVSEVFGRTWEIFKANWGLCIGTVIGCGVLNTLSGQVPNLIMTLVGGVGAGPGGFGGPVPGAGPVPIAGPGNNPAQMQMMLMLGVGVVVLSIVAAIFQLWIGIGQAIVLLNIARGRDTSFSDVFRGGPFLIRVFLSSILFGLVVFGGMLVGAIPGAVVAVTGSVGDRSTLAGIFAIGVLVALGIMSIVMIRLSQYYYLIVDRGVGAMASLGISMEITKGRVVGLAALGLLALLVNFGGLLACGVGLVVTIPFTVLMFPVAYLALVGGPVADPAGRGKPYVSGDPLAEF